MRPLRSVGAQLSLALVVVVAAALGAVYVVVVPSLERNLVDAKRSQLERVAPVLQKQFGANPFNPDFIENAAATANARVVLFEPLAPPSPALLVAQDSRGGVNSSDVEKDPLALRASVTLESRSGTVTRGDERFVEVAVPVDEAGDVVLLSAPLHDALGSVHLVQRRLLVAALTALALSLLLGFGGSAVFARRVRRLERAADRIAGGSFDEPVQDSSPDELGQLARAFDSMRLRLAQLDHARGEFIANASHELRTPLFSLGGFLELLGDEDLDEETRREFLETMREQVERLTKLATDLLDLSRLDAGRLRVERQPIDLDEVARSLVEEFQAVAQRSGRSLELEADEPVPALADDERALQAGRSLVENALRHTGPESRVTVRAAVRGTAAVLEVEDDGAGVPAAQTEMIFERFYRADGTLASGSGLGLAIAKELAELMDGRIELESRPGRTVFALVLPVAAFSRENVPAEVN